MLLHLHRPATVKTNKTIVILDMHPAFTTIIILFGWIAKTAMAEFIGRWIASDEKTGEAWLAYSIP